MDSWTGPSGALGQLVEAESRANLEAYRAQPNLVEEHAGIEISNIEGGYGRKQLHELVQNGADAMRRGSGRIALVLTQSHLYCANEGGPLDARGIAALMGSHLSTKRDDQIGRFGLGFKSVLGISDEPEILSRTVSLRFDRGATRDRIRVVLPSATRTPVLRTATPIDPTECARADATLKTLMDWATTVVRLPLRADVNWIGAELASFPSEFLLFVDHVVRLELDDRTSNVRREVRAARKGSAVVLAEGGTSSAWNVFRTTHRPSAAALEDAGELAGRDSVDLAWAVPRARRSTVGTFWAFFPTTAQSTLTGIVNAPFKTTEDRHNILDGAYNRELVEKVLPELVVSALSDILDQDDPGSLIEVLPARGREGRSWADDALNEPVMRGVARAACLPNGLGQLRVASALNLQPTVVEEHPSWAALWWSLPGIGENWVHQSATRTTERRAKVDRLLALARSAPASVEKWLEAAADRGGATGSSVAIQLADGLNSAHASDVDILKAVRKVRIVLTETNSLAPVTVGRIFIPNAPEDTGPSFVCPALVEDPAALDALKNLGIGLLDALGRLDAQIAAVSQSARIKAVKGAEIEGLWKLIRSAPRSEALERLKKAFPDGVPVRTVSSRVRSLSRCLLPGTVVPGDGSRDADVCVDTRFHGEDFEILTALGATDGPRVGTPRADERWFGEWLAYAKGLYLAAAQSTGARIAPASVSVRPGRCAVGLDVLEQLSPEGQAALTREALRGPLDDWISYAEARAAVAPVRVINPARWWLSKHGAVTTPYGVIPVGEAWAPQAGIPAHLLPVPVDLTNQQLVALGVRSSPGAQHWEELLPRAGRTVRPDELATLYIAAAQAGCPRPGEMWVARDGGRAVAESGDVVVTNDLPACELLESTHDVLLVPSEADLNYLVKEWGLQDARPLLTRRILAAPSGEAIPLQDWFPGLRLTAPGVPVGYELVPSAEISVQINSNSDSDGLVVHAEEVVVEDETAYFVDTLDDESLLSLLNSRLRLGLSDHALRQTLEIGQRQALGKVEKAVRAAETTEEKLIALAGEDEVRKLVPAEAIRAAETRKGRALKPTEVAKMAQTSGGGQILRKLAPAIEKRGIVVPTQLAGGNRATSFAQNLGLPSAFAGSKENDRPEREMVPGPVRLPELHPYQAQTIAMIRALITSSDLTRGLVELPTGSGKTRVAVEAMIDHIRERSAEALVVWIAQSDELCEQAVETWSYLWRAIGPHESSLTLNRLWASNDATKAENGPQVVVVTDDKLVSLSRKGAHEWLREAELVIVDEAHTSVSKTYTELFNWLGRGARERNRPLLGLSATPYRGHNEEQTLQLVRRYDSNLLTAGLFGEQDPHNALQDMGILARVKHDVLQGMDLQPLPSSSRESDRFMMLEARVDLQKVATDDGRNSRIIDSILALDQELTVLVFAASVQHAEQLAAVLSISDVPAAAVSAYTPPAERRDLVKRFQAGDVRVLTNYNVLSQGFDAPRVGAVYVARPTFSPNRYQQMIGRGLRGPKNGGSEEVLIVNVKDNIDAFGEQLAFHHFDFLWNEA